MKASYMGLAVPLYPDSASDGIHIEAEGSAATYDILTITQSSAHTGDFLVLEDGDGSTEILVIEEDGVTNWAVSQPGADNVLALTITDSTTVTSGYLQGYYTSLTTGGAYSTANTQINAFAVDLLLGGTVACEAEGMYVYVAKSGSPTLTSSNINGINVYIDDLGSSPSVRSAIQLHIADGNAGSTADGFIYCRIEGGSGAVTNLIEKGGTATNPTYFLKTNATDGMINAGDVTSSGATAQSLVCLVGGAIRHIPLYTNS